MKLSKIEAYRVYLLCQHIWSLVIRYAGNTTTIEKELDRLWEDHYKKITRIPRSAPTLVVMKTVILDSSFVHKYLPKNTLD